MWTREFGLSAAVYHTARKLDLPGILEKRFPADRSGVPIWSYFLVTTINRMAEATIKNRMSQWLGETIIPDLLGVDPNKFTSKNFWYAMDEILPQKLARIRRRDSQANELFAPINEDVFAPVEMEVFKAVDRLIGLAPGLFIYDTTNFYTYIEEPKRSDLAAACHSKESNQWDAFGLSEMARMLLY